MSEERVQEIIQILGLKEMNLESGLFEVDRVSDIEIGGQQASNSIYFMLTRDMPQSYLQHMDCDDTQILIEGGPVDYYLFYEDGTCENKTMGRDIGQGEHMMISVPGGTAKGLILRDEAEYLLIGSVVTPAWSPTNTRYGADESFLNTYEGKAPWATRDFLKSIVGPNFGSKEGGRLDDRHVIIDAHGQIIFQGMQLTEQQLQHEMTKFEPGSMTIEISPGAPQELVERIRAFS